MKLCRMPLPIPAEVVATVTPSRALWAILFTDSSPITLPEALPSKRMPLPPFASAVVPSVATPLLFASMLVWLPRMRMPLPLLPLMTLPLPNAPPIVFDEAVLSTRTPVPLGMAKAVVSTGPMKLPATVAPLPASSTPTELPLMTLPIVDDPMAIEEQVSQTKTPVALTIGPVSDAFVPMYEPVMEIELEPEVVAG